MMTARAIWKAVIQCGAQPVPVKLYSAIEDRDIHFRVLSRKYKQPVHQAMVNPETGVTVPHAETLRAYIADNGDRILLKAAELEALEPASNRDIDVLAFLPPAQFDNHGYDRPFFLGPDGNSDACFGFAQALANSGTVGLVRWVMRGRSHVGALRPHHGHLALISLRNADELISSKQLQAPPGAALNPKELEMARQLVGMLAADLDLSQFRDQYRERVIKLVESKARGRPRLKLVKPVAKAPSEDLGRALQASLKAARRSA